MHLTHRHASRKAFHAAWLRVFPAPKQSPRPPTRGNVKPLGCFPEKIFMKIFHKSCQAIGLITIINFILFVFIAIIIGGDALNGHAENGHYFLANHGELTEVNYWVFMYSKIHAYSVFISFPLAILASFLYWITGGQNIRPKSEAVEIPHSADNIFAIIKSLFWKISDLVGGFFWVIIDSWRKPDYELFVRLSKHECIRELKLATDNEPEMYKLEKPLWGYFSGNYFYLQKWVYIFFLKDGGDSIRPILFGKFSPTPQGTYIRLWHRFTTFATLFFTGWFGTVLIFLSLYFIKNNTYANQLKENFESTLVPLAWIIVPIIYISTLFVFIQIGSFMGRVNNLGIIEFVKNVLDHHHDSGQLAGFRLSQKLKGKL
jgi:hypothetical protein